MFVGDLRATLDELGQDYRLPGAETGHLIELCPRCKRVTRGQAYFEANGPSFADVATLSPSAERTP